MVSSSAARGQRWSRNPRNGPAPLLLLHENFSCFHLQLSRQFRRPTEESDAEEEEGGGEEEEEEEKRVRRSGAAGGRTLVWRRGNFVLPQTWKETQATRGSTRPTVRERASHGQGEAGRGSRVWDGLERTGGGGGTSLSPPYREKRISWKEKS